MGLNKYTYNYNPSKDLFNTMFLSLDDKDACASKIILDSKERQEYKDALASLIYHQPDHNDMVGYNAIIILSVPPDVRISKSRG